jgi:hypothetical protein
VSAQQLRRWGAVATAVAMALAAGMACAAEQPKPWRLGTALSAPDWFTLGGTYRVRYETLDNPYRAGASGSDEILVERLLVNARVDIDHVFANVELQDSRQQLADSGTPLGTDIVNTLEPLQAYVGMRFSDALAKGDHLDFQLGRVTIDNGSRRLLARNSYRNTINAFSGLHATWKGSDGAEVQALFLQPVQRKPSDFASLKDNDQELDTDSGDARLWGVFVSQPRLIGNITGEVYFYGFRSRDHVGIPVADRDLYTPGARVFSKPAAGAWDLEVEGAYQWGTSRASTAASDRRDLQHEAGFFHGEVGYTLKANLSPRFEISYDFASGDHNPGDNENNRFDTLYGARRFDFGPTGIYGAFARANINTPGLRLELKPSKKISAMVGYRAVWLASDKDQYTTARLQDPTGRSGSFIGNQLEAQVQYNVLPGNVALEFGGAYLMHGEFLDDAPNAPDEGDTTYLYAAATLTF